VDVACGHSHTLAVTADGKLFCWGRGDSGELGQGNLTDRSMPHPVKPLERHHWARAVAGSYYTAAIADPGEGRRKSPGEISEDVAKVRRSVYKDEEEQRARYLGGAPAEEAAEEADPAALPEGWDYEYDGASGPGLACDRGGEERGGSGGAAVLCWPLVCPVHVLAYPLPSALTHRRRRKHLLYQARREHNMGRPPRVRRKRGVKPSARSVGRCRPLPWQRVLAILDQSYR